MINHSTEELNPISPRDFLETMIDRQVTDQLLEQAPISPHDFLETMIGRLILDIALGASKVCQQSMFFSVVYDNRPSLARRRESLENTTATYLAGLYNLAKDHGLAPLRKLGMTDLEIVRLAVAPLNREEPTAPAGRDPLAAFTDERLVDALYELSGAIRTWERAAAAESTCAASSEEAGAIVLAALAKATAAARREEALS